MWWGSKQIVSFFEESLLFTQSQAWSCLLERFHENDHQHPIVKALLDLTFPGDSRPLGDTWRGVQDQKSGLTTNPYAGFLRAGGSMFSPGAGLSKLQNSPHRDLFPLTIWRAASYRASANFITLKQVICSLFSNLSNSYNDGFRWLWVAYSVGLAVSIFLNLPYC